MAEIEEVQDSDIEDPEGAASPENGTTSSQDAGSQNDQAEPMVQLPNGTKVSEKELYEGYLRTQDYTKKNPGTCPNAQRT